MCAKQAVYQLGCILNTQIFHSEGQEFKQVFLGEITEVLAELLSYAKTSGEGCLLPWVLRRKHSPPQGHVQDPHACLRKSTLGAEDKTEVHLVPSGTRQSSPIIVSKRMVLCGRERQNGSLPVDRGESSEERTEVGALIATQEFGDV